MSIVLSWLKEPVFIIGATALVVSGLIGTFIESFGVEDRAEATVSPKAPQPALPAEPPQLDTNMGFVPIDGDPMAPWPDDGHETLFTFVQLSDTHVGSGDDHKAFLKAVRVINDMAPQPEFVMITGDLTDSFTPAQIKLFKSINDKLRPRTYLVPGNHDVMFDITAKRVAWWEREFSDFKTPYRVDHGPLALIGVDSQLWNARRRSRSADRIADKQWRDMERLVSEARADGQRIFIFNHIPAMPTFYRTRIARSWKSDRMDDYLEMMKTHGVEAELSGHVHRDEMYLEGETLFLSAPPISEKYTRLASLRLFRVTARGLMYRQIYLRPRGKHLTYQMDLHGIDERDYHDWIEGMDNISLAELWKYRHAGDLESGPWFPNIDHKRFRAYLLDPFDHQPTKGMSTRFNMRFPERP